MADNNTLAAFAEANPTPEKMLWRSGALHQMAVMRMALDLVKHYATPVDLVVVGSHMSKSIHLPVVQITAPGLGLRIGLRDNFHNWAVSVDSASPADGEFSPPVSFDPTYSSSIYFEGFDEAGIKVHGSWEDDQRRFSGHIWNGDAALMLFLVRLLDSLGQIRA